jgi:hypothetical protein
MTRRTLIPLIIVGIIVAMLGGGYAIVARNDGDVGSRAETPSGFFH